MVAFPGDRMPVRAALSAALLHSNFDAVRLACAHVGFGGHTTAVGWAATLKVSRPLLSAEVSDGAKLSDRHQLWALRQMHRPL